MLYLIKMLQPKRTKYRKSFRMRGQLKGLTNSGFNVSFGEFAIIAVSAGELTSRHIEAARQTISRKFDRKGKIIIRVYPHVPVTQKSAEVPMGFGKGSVEFYVAKVKAGRVLIEVSGVSEFEARAAFRLVSYKLPLRTRVVSRNDF
jgi:large subunit ribosomal protein L16